MADMVDIPTNVLVALGGVGTAVTGAVAYLWKGKQAELDRANARHEAEIDKKNAKIDELQTKFQSALQAQVEAEPLRRETLASMGRAQAETNALLKELLQLRRT